MRLSRLRPCLGTGCCTTTPPRCAVFPTPSPAPPVPGRLPHRQLASSRAEAPAWPPVTARPPALAQANYSPDQIGRLLAPAYPVAGSPGRATPAAACAPARPASSLSASSTGPGRRLPRPTSDDDDCALACGPRLPPRPSRPMPTPRQSAPARPPGLPCVRDLPSFPARSGGPPLLRATARVRCRAPRAPAVAPCQPALARAGSPTTRTPAAAVPLLPTAQVVKEKRKIREEGICVRLSDVRPTASCLAGCKKHDRCVRVRLPSRLKKKKKKTK
ncbi:hypothetical protein VPH35_031901 [Triticum aestivum]